MLPKDDQLIPYGLDTTVSVTRSFPLEFQFTTVEKILLSYKFIDVGKQIPDGIVTHYKHQKNTRYVIKNNSTDRTIKKFYIDHTADTAYNGYIITTKVSNCIKKVTGFCRYEFSLNPLQEIEFMVSEEATDQRTSQSINDLTTFIKTKADPLIKQGVIEKTFVDTVRNIVMYREILAALNQVETESGLTEKNVMTWRQGASVAVPIEDSEGKVLPPASLIPSALLEKIEAILELDKRKRETRRMINVHSDSIRKIFENQSRLRENIKSFEKMEKIIDNNLVKRYLKDLDSQEDELIVTRTKIDELEFDEVQLDGQLKFLKLEVISDAKKEKEALSSSIF